MPRLARGGKWIYGWVIVGPGLALPIPPEAWRQYGFQFCTPPIGPSPFTPRRFDPPMAVW
jgi:hypothetical protein